MFGSMVAGVAFTLSRLGGGGSIRKRALSSRAAQTARDLTKGPDPPMSPAAIFVTFGLRGSRKPICVIVARQTARSLAARSAPGDSSAREGLKLRRLAQELDDALQ
jgi:hypothetical protein